MPWVNIYVAPRMRTENLYNSDFSQLHKSLAMYHNVRQELENDEEIKYFIAFEMRTGLFGIL